MQFTHEIEQMCCVEKGCNHGPAPIPQEGNWTQSREITDISGLTHGVGWCAPQQGTCKLTLNVKNGIIEEALVETMRLLRHDPFRRHGRGNPARQDRAGSTEHRPRVRRHQHRHARTVPADRLRPHPDALSPKDGLPIGAGLEDLGKGLRSQVGTMYGTEPKGVRYLEMAEGYITEDCPG